MIEGAPSKSGNDGELPESLARQPLTERDDVILHVLQEEGLTGFTFDGLKRRLGLHPETLSRALDRLEEQGAIQKVQGGYKVTARAKELLILASLSTKESPVPLVQTLLPHDISIPRIISDLKGRWFGDLRWVGYSENEEGIVLKWITEDGAIQVDAKFYDGELNIEAKLREGKDVNEAVRASHQLMSYVARLYSKQYGTRRIVSFTVFDPYRMLS